jgi:hypothetical protein
MLRLFSIGRSHGEISFMMSRYKGRTSPKAIEQAYPHVVEMIVPPGGFGKSSSEFGSKLASTPLEATKGAASALRLIPPSPNDAGSGCEPWAVIRPRLAALSISNVIDVLPDPAEHSEDDCCLTNHIALAHTYLGTNRRNSM